MFLNRRKSNETAGEESSAADDVKKKKGKKTPAAGNEDDLVAEIAGLEEMVNRRTRDLEAAKTQLHQMQKAPGIPEDLKKEAAAEELLTRPNKARRAPVVPAEEAELKKEGEKSGEGAERKLEKADAREVETAQAAEPAQTGEPAEAGESDDFFSNDEQEENRLAGLIASLPDVTVSEILREAEEVKALVREWLPDKEG